MSKATPTSATQSSVRGLADPLVHARAVAASALIGTAAAAAVGLLWTAVAFSSHDSWAYNHLAWWLGATVIGAAVISGAIAGILSATRGVAAGAANGFTTGAVIVALAGGIALVALAVNGSLDQPLVVGGHTVIVDFLRPYVAFWAAAGGVVLAGLGGVAGGMLPRRQAGHQVVELAPVSSIRAESLVMSNGPAAAGF